VISFLDTSVLVKRYVAEPGSTLVRNLFSKNRHIAVSRITYAEVAAAVARRVREGSLAVELRDKLMARLDADFQTFTVSEIRQTTVKSAATLCVRHQLRAYDAMQLASALTIWQAVSAVDFLTTDLVLRRAATAEGLRATAVG
jgi:predicted nucleic acid-binding protein